MSDINLDKEIAAINMFSVDEVNVWFAKVEPRLQKTFCNYFLSTDEYKNGDKTKPIFIICCDKLDYCTWYKQTWFFLACGGAGFLILIIIIIVVACCCCKKGGGGKSSGRRGKGGADVEIID